MPSQVNADVIEIATRLLVPTSPPTSASATGVTGTITWDSDYIYICIGTNTWKRVAITTW